MTISIEIRELPQPLLEFGSPGEFFEQKEGLMQAGPFDLRFGGAHRTQVRLGMVGPADMIERAFRWYDRCQNTILSGMKNIEQYPFFPGFRETFKAALVLDDRWTVEFDEESHELDNALALKPKERFERVLELYAQGVSRIAASDLRPDVVVCCVPEKVIKVCWSITNELTEAEWKAIKHQKRRKEDNQPGLFDAWEMEETPEDLLYRDFRRALKARAMKVNMPIQIGRDKLFVDSDSNQDPATRAWNMSVALYYKAGGIPWRTKNNGPETCFVGISFHHLKTNKRHLVHSSIAQAFSTEGDGFALRGESVPWNPDQGRNIHLTDEQAAQLAEKVLIQYRERSGGDPMRVVLHKTSKFDGAELSGFKSAFRNIPIVETINLAPSMFRLVQFGAYPPKRGTLCRVNQESTYLFTSGYMPEWNTYPGPHIPAPLRLVPGGDIDVYRAAADVLSLTRMNWNTAQNTNSQPVTLRFARQVGGIMAEIGEDEEPKPSYRFYM
ncbi:MAG: hypothetical protein LC803_21175 [Acidobacteria bacterium]|nr:hypothetical protein [Acidobacteriota bacterium]